MGEYQRTISIPERQVGRQALRLVEGGGTQADLAGDDMVRIEVRDACLPGSGRVVSFELREASAAV